MSAKNNILDNQNEFHPHEIVWSDEKIDRLWGYYSGSEFFQEEYFSYQAGRTVLKQIEKHVNVRKLSTILDYGCGPGFLIEVMLERLHGGQKCYGLDFSKKSAALVEKKFAHHPLYGGTFWAESLPSVYQDESMDMVISLEVIEHLDDDRLFSMAKEIYRILKPCGYLVITTPNRENFMKNKSICPECGAIFHRWQHVRTWTASTLEQFMAECGFKKIHIVESNFATKHQRLIKYFLRVFPHKKDRLFFIGAK